MEEKKPYLGVIIIQFIYAGMFLLSKAALDGGMNSFTFVFYRQAFATVFLAPIVFFFERENAQSISFLTCFKTFMLSLFGITLSLNLNGIALVYTSATLAAATANSLPVITFILALLFGMESLKLRSRGGVAKVIGVIGCIGGVVILALYKGPQWRLPFCPHHRGPHQEAAAPAGGSWIKGCFLMLSSNTLWGLWLVLQVRVMKEFPSKLLFTALQCLLSSIQSFGIAIFVEREFLEWKLAWDIRLLAIIYCGFVVTGVSFYMQSWVIEKKGPVFLAMSTPLALVFTTLSSAFLFCAIVSFGSALGGLLLVFGLYCVLWGKGQEQIKDDIVCTGVKIVDG